MATIVENESAVAELKQLLQALPGLIADAVAAKIEAALATAFTPSRLASEATTTCLSCFPAWGAKAASKPSSASTSSATAATANRI